MPSARASLPVHHAHASIADGAGAAGVVVGKVYLVARPQYPARPATVLECRIGKHGQSEAYVSFVGEDKRLDTWVLGSQVGQEVIDTETTSAPSQAALLQASLPSDTVEVQLQPTVNQAPQAGLLAHSTPEVEHANMTRVRNFEDVRFGEYLIKTWYYSPYPKPVPMEDRAVSPVPPAMTTGNGHGHGHGQKKRKLNGNGNADSPIDNSSGAQPFLSVGSKGGSKLHDMNGKSGLKKERSVQDIYAASMGKNADGTRGRIWVCDLCFKYMRTRAAWDRHTTGCDMMTPPGRRVYQKGSYTMWEVDGAQAPLYCQNLSLFGKLFIDHKSVFFYVENFLFYVLCDAATSRRDQVMAFFSKEKVSYDDHNLACIITFPPFQNRGFGKLMIEYSYYLTLHPSTRPASLSPGTPERPLSDLGLKGYTAYWTSVILRFCHAALADAPSSTLPPPPSPARPQRSRRISTANSTGRAESVVTVQNGVEVIKTVSHIKGQYSISLPLVDLAKACHLRIDDVVSTLTELGFLRHRRRLLSGGTALRASHEQSATSEPTSQQGLEDLAKISTSSPTSGSGVNENEWKDVEVIISRDAVNRQWEKWKVRPKGVLDETCVLL